MLPRKRSGPLAPTLLVRFTKGKRAPRLMYEGLVPVHDSKWFARDGPGKTRCTLCDRVIGNDTKSRQRHLETELHLSKLNLK